MLFARFIPKRDRSSMAYGWCNGHWANMFRSVVEWKRVPSNWASSSHTHTRIRLCCIEHHLYYLPSFTLRTRCWSDILAIRKLSNHNLHIDWRRSINASIEARYMSIVESFGFSHGVAVCLVCYSEINFQPHSNCRHSKWDSRLHYQIRPSKRIWTWY